MIDRLVHLRALLRARENRNEYRDSVPMIRAEIERLEKEQSDGS